MLIYLSGPISGKPDNNKPEFTYYSKKFRSRGWEVINPLELDEDENRPYGDCIKKDLIEFLNRKVDAVYFLGGAKGSRGATLEKHLADLLDIPTYEAWSEHLIPKMIWFRLEWPNALSVTELTKS